MIYAYTGELPIIIENITAKEGILRTQKIIMVQAEKYDELVGKIQDEINDREDTMEIQKIDYFCMNDYATGTCTAIILFRSKNGQGN